MDTSSDNGRRSPVVRIIRWVATIVVVAGILEGLLQANVQKLAEQEGWDKLLADHWHPTMDRLSDFLAHQWTWNFIWYCAGVASALWLVRLFPERKKSGQSNNLGSVETHPLAHALHMPSNSGMSVAVDARKKSIQIGFHLRNSSEIPLRYEVKQITAVIEGKTVMNAIAVNRSYNIARGDTGTFMFAPIPHTIGKKDAQAEASILYTYGPAAPGEPQVREANYRVSLTIGPKSHSYLILEENDGEI